MGSKLEHKWLDGWQESDLCQTFKDFVLCVMGSSWRILSKRLIGSDLCIKSTFWMTSCHEVLSY